MQPCCSRAGNGSFCITVTALNSSSSPDIKLWKSARGFKTHLRLREILQDHFMSDWNRCPLTSLVQALAAHHIILYVAGWLRIMIWPEMGVISYFCWGPLLPSYDQCVSDFAFWCLDSSLWDNFLLMSGPNASLWWKAWAGQLDRTEPYNRAGPFSFFFHSFQWRVLCSQWGGLVDLILRNLINENLMYLSEKRKTAANLEGDNVKVKKGSFAQCPV